MNNLHRHYCAERKRHAKNNDAWKYFLTWNAHCGILNSSLKVYKLWHDPMYTGNRTYNGWSEAQLEDFIHDHHQSALVGLKTESDLSNGIYWSKTMPRRKAQCS